MAIRTLEVIASPRVRWACPEDMPELASIERESFASPWPNDQWMRARLHWLTRIAVAHDGERVAGYAVITEAERSIEIINLAVSRPLRRGGVGRSLVIAMLRRSTIYREAKSVVAYMSQSNLTAQLFFKSLGFTGSVQRDHYGIGRDAYAFRFNPPQRPAGGAIQRRQSATLSR